METPDWLEYLEEGMKSEPTDRTMPFSEEDDISASAEPASEELESSGQPPSSHQLPASAATQSDQPSPSTTPALPTGQPDGPWKRPPLLVLKDRALDHQHMQQKLTALDEKIRRMGLSGELLPDEESIEFQEQRRLYTLHAKSFPRDGI